MKWSTQVTGSAACAGLSVRIGSNYPPVTALKMHNEVNNKIILTIEMINNILSETKIKPCRKFWVRTGSVLFSFLIVVKETCLNK